LVSLKLVKEINTYTKIEPDLFRSSTLHCHCPVCAAHCAIDEIIGFGHQPCPQHGTVLVKNVGGPQHRSLPSCACPQSATPPLSLSEPAKPQNEAAPKAKPRIAPIPAEKSISQAAKTWTQVVREHLKKLDNAGQFYPAEAIARGLEGEVHVLLIIDEAGKVSAARQVVLPVRFQLKS